MPITEIIIDHSIKLGKWQNFLKNPSYIIIHCSGYTENILLSIWKNLKVGTHYFLPAPTYFVKKHLKINENYKNFIDKLDKPNAKFPCFCLANADKIVKHAGISQWEDQGSFNNLSIGIELHLPNYANALTIIDEIKQTLGTDATDEQIIAEMNQHPEKFTAIDFNYAEEYPPEQIQALIILLKQIIDNTPTVKAENILGHNDIAAWRYDSDNNLFQAKTDPGHTFPWLQLAKEGLGIWPKEIRTRAGAFNPNIKNIQTLLKKIGYHLTITGTIDKKTFYTMLAFIRHFLPKRYKNLSYSYSNEACQKILTAMSDEKALTYLENLADKKYEYKLYMNDI